MTRLGDFEKFLRTNFRAKVAKKIGDFWAVLKYYTYFLVETAVATFWANCGNIRTIFIPTSGHTASKSKEYKQQWDRWG